jgi:hypothetical protein
MEENAVGYWRKSAPRKALLRRVNLPPRNWFAQPDGNRSRLFPSKEKHSFLRISQRAAGQCEWLWRGFECARFRQLRLYVELCDSGTEGNMQRRAIANYACH